MDIEETYRILAENIKINNNTQKTGINNNDLIIGPSGSGKTIGYVIPNVINAEESMIVVDTKGNLQHKLGMIMENKGYKVISIDFKEISESRWGYNPLDFIRQNPVTHEYNEQDIITIARGLCPVQTLKDPFWEQAAQMYLECIISYVKVHFTDEERTLKTVARVASYIGTEVFDNMMSELEDVEPDCFAIRRYRQMCSNRHAERMEASIKGFVFNALNPFDNLGTWNLFNNKQKIQFKQLSIEKTVVFVNVSDTDRSRDALVNLFYTQALQELCREADSRIPKCRLKIPVRFILDDFATNTLIPDFDNIISVIRSREIYVSLIIQSISQLEGLYGVSASKTIINNCDNILYLGGQDVDTAKYMSIKLNKTMSTVLNLPLNAAFLFTRGSAPREVQKIIPGGQTCKEIAFITQETMKAVKEERRRKQNEEVFG